MHKDGKWAREVMSSQLPDGSWGCFHTLSAARGFPITTEQALRRLEALGCTINDECVKRAVAYMTDCLEGRREIPDVREKSDGWDSFVELMLAVRIRRFTADNPRANAVADKWAGIISPAFAGGEYDHQAYIKALSDAGVISLGSSKKTSRYADFSHFYALSILPGFLNAAVEDAMLDYVINHDSGIYYIYDGCVSNPPMFAGKTASRYLSALELLAAYPRANRHLGYALDWLMANRGEDCKWDMGRDARDNTYLPLSDDWRTADRRKADCTERIEKLLDSIQTEEIYDHT